MMAKAHTKVVNGLTYASIWCVGCRHPHSVPVRQTGDHEPRPSWEFDGNLESPTMRPSLLVNGPGKHHHPSGPICHSWITNGRIQFLPDSTHDHAGQTLDLPEYPEEWT